VFQLFDLLWWEPSNLRSFATQRTALLFRQFNWNNLVIVRNVQSSVWARINKTVHTLRIFLIFTAKYVVVSWGTSWNCKTKWWSRSTSKHLWQYLQQVLHLKRLCTGNGERWGGRRLWLCGNTFSWIHSWSTLDLRKAMNRGARVGLGLGVAQAETSIRMFSIIFRLSDRMSLVFVNSSSLIRDISTPMPHMKLNFFPKIRENQWLHSTCRDVTLTYNLKSCDDFH